MNTHNFKIFVEALEALPESIKNNNVNMASIAISFLGCSLFNIYRFKITIWAILDVSYFPIFGVVDFKANAAPAMLK
jgi:hypothetical protein